MIAKHYYNGRADGLGNRIEEIVWLEAVCDKFGIEIVYIWNNLYQHRHYPILFETKNVRVTERGAGCDFFSPPADIKAKITQSDILSAARRIKPKFDIHFVDNIRPLGIHIRGTDRIGKDHPHFIKDSEQFERLLVKTIHRINALRPLHPFVCADDENYMKRLLSHIDKDIRIAKPVCSRGVVKEYRDFFALTLCEQIYMCSRFSTFSICASLVGNIPLVSFYRSEEVENRYKALFNYDMEDIKDEAVHCLKFAEASDVIGGGKLARLKISLSTLFKGR